MFFVENYTVLVIINIGRILEAPVSAVDSHGNYTVVLPCGRIDTAGIAHILIAQKTLGIARLLRKLCRSDDIRLSACRMQ